MMMMMVTDPVRIIWEITTIIDHTTTRNRSRLVTHSGVNICQIKPYSHQN